MVASKILDVVNVTIHLSITSGNLHNVRSREGFVTIGTNIQMQNFTLANNLGSHNAFGGSNNNGHRVARISNGRWGSILRADGSGWCIRINLNMAVLKRVNNGGTLGTKLIEEIAHIASDVASSIGVLNNVGASEGSSISIDKEVHVSIAHNCWGGGDVDRGLNGYDDCLSRSSKMSVIGVVSVEAVVHNKAGAARCGTSNFSDFIIRESLGVENDIGKGASETSSSSEGDLWTSLGKLIWLNGGNIKQHSVNVVSDLKSSNGFRST